MPSRGVVRQAGQRPSRASHPRPAPAARRLFRRALLTLAGLSGALAPAGTGAAQEPDTVPAADTLPAPDTVAAPDDTAAARARAAAVGRYIPPRFALSVTGGTLGLGELQTQPVAAELLDAAGGTTETETLDRMLGVGDGFHVGVSALIGLSGAWALRGGASWGSATLSAGYAGEDAFEAAAGDLETPASTDLTVLSAEGALRFRMASSRRVQPYAELGAAVLRIEAENPAFPGAGALTGETSVAGLAALGAIVPLVGPLAARIQASGHFLRTPLRLAPEGALVGAVDTLRVTFASPEAAPFADPARELVRALRLDAGLSLELWRPRRQTAGPAARPTGSHP